jgi:hypothetical protein
MSVTFSLASIYISHLPRKSCPVFFTTSLKFHWLANLTALATSWALVALTTKLGKLPREHVVMAYRAGHSGHPTPAHHADLIKAGSLSQLLRGILQATGAVAFATNAIRSNLSYLPGFLKFGTMRLPFKVRLNLAQSSADGYVRSPGYCCTPY